jgi:hypothetical protein
MNYEQNSLNQSKKTKNSKSTKTTHAPLCATESIKVRGDIKAKNGTFLAIQSLSDFSKNK